MKLFLKSTEISYAFVTTKILFDKNISSSLKTRAPFHLLLSHEDIFQDIYPCRTCHKTGVLTINPLGLTAKRKTSPVACSVKIHVLDMRLSRLIHRLIKLSRRPVRLRVLDHIPIWAILPFFHFPRCLGDDLVAIRGARMLYRPAQTKKQG